MAAETGSPSVWAAPYADEPVEARVTLPGSKSVTNRAYVLSALADGPSTIRNPLVARDTTLMLRALESLGTRVEEQPDGVRITPQPLRGPARVDCGLAGTVMRFVPAVAALADGSVDFDGDPRARERPMSTLLEALRTLGVAIEPAATSLPFRVDGHGSVPGGSVSLDASASSQFVSALLLAGARYDEGVSVRHAGPRLPSRPHVEMTVDMLRHRSVEVDTNEPDRWTVIPGPIAARSVDVEPDLSNAAPFLAAAVVTGGRVNVPGWPMHTTQAGDRLRDILTRFGATVRLDESGLTVTGGEDVAAVDLDLHDVGELTPVVAALAALASAPSRLRGIAHLRGHETDRLAALATELRLLGCEAREHPDGLEILPKPLTGGLFNTYEDHRMAHAAVVLGLVVPDVLVDNIATTAKTFPDFATAWTAMLG